MLPLDRLLLGHGHSCHPPANSEHDVNKSKVSLLTPYLTVAAFSIKQLGPMLGSRDATRNAANWYHTPNEPMLQQCVQEMWNRLKEG